VDDPPPELDDPVPLDGSPVPVLDEPVLELEDPVPVDGSPVPVLDEPVPVLEDPLPLDGSPVPVLDEPVLELDEPVPLDGSPVPVLDEPVPLDGSLDAGAPLPSVRVSLTKILESTLMESERLPALMTRASIADVEKVALTPSTVATMAFPLLASTMEIVLASLAVPVTVRVPPDSVGLTVIIKRDSRASKPWKCPMELIAPFRRRRGLAALRVPSKSRLSGETRTPRVRFARAITSPNQEKTLINKSGSPGTARSDARKQQRFK
jgi:hypothetical protein